MTVVAYDCKIKSVTMRSEEGEWDVDPIHLDTEWTFNLDGKYFAENTRKAKAYLKSLIIQNQIGSPKDC